MYRDGGYIQVVEDCARESMAKVAEEMKTLDDEVSLFMFISYHGKYKFFLLSG